MKLEEEEEKEEGKKSTESNEITYVDLRAAFYDIAMRWDRLPLDQLHRYEFLTNKQFHHFSYPQYCRVVCTAILVDF